ncbi:MAG TPA: hypothetical protein VG889_04845 [Rhizomicrobium sp.]|nr:hypothetical protein [Rhizomicrobium sp.]
METLFRRAILILLFFVLLIVLIGLLWWLFYCQCRPLCSYFRACGEQVGTVSSDLGRGTVPPHHVERGRFPHFDPPQDDYNDDSGRAVPDGPLRGTLAPTVKPSLLLKIEPNKQSVPPQGAAGDPVVFRQYDPLGTKAGGVGSPPDMNAARNGNVILLSYNTAVLLSTDGADYTLLDPTTIFPSGPAKDSSGNLLDRGLCCDQIVRYVPQIDRFVWLMQFCGSNATSCLQGVNKVRIAVASTQDVIASGGTKWTYWDLTSASVNIGASTMDYPDLSIGDNSLYFSADAVSGGGLLVVRMPLSDLQAGGTLNFQFTAPADSALAYGGHITQNTGDTLFWAGHKDNSTIRVFSMAENSGQYSWRDIAIDSWPKGAAISSIAPDGKDWLSFGFPGNAVLGATRRTADEVWFAWTAGSNANFKNPHVRVLQLKVSDFSVVKQWDIWNDDYAFAYPSLATNGDGEVGISLGWGGGTFYGNNAVGILGDFVVWYPELSDAVLASSPIRFGDYFSVARATPTPTLFDASGYAVFKNTPPATGTRVDPYYIQFGRDSAVNGGAPNLH